MTTADPVVDCRHLRRARSASRHDLVFLAGHFSANSALAADYQTQRAHDRARRLVGQPGEQHRLRRRLPRGLQPRRWRRPDRCRAAARLGAGVRAEARDARRRHRLPVRRHRLPRVQRAALPRLRPRAPRRRRRHAVPIGEALAAAKRTTSRGPRTSAASTRRPARGDALRPADVGVNMPPGRTGARRRAAASRRPRSPADLPPARPRDQGPLGPTPPRRHRLASSTSSSRPASPAPSTRPGSKALRRRRRTPPSRRSRRTSSTSPRRATTSCCAASASAAARTPILERPAAHRCTNDGAARRPRALRVARLLPDADVDRRTTSASSSSAVRT